MKTDTRVHFSLKISLCRTVVKLVCTRQHLQFVNSLKTDSKTVRNVVKNKNKPLEKSCFELNYIINNEQR